MLLGTYFHLRLVEEGDLAWLLASGYGEREALKPFNTELCLGSLRVICADLLGQPLPVAALELDYPEPPAPRRSTARPSTAPRASAARAAASASPPMAGAPAAPGRPCDPP